MANGSDREAPEEADVSALAPDLTTRIGAILRAVQREADELLEEARGEAQRLLEEGAPAADPVGERTRRLAELSDRLLEGTARVYGQLEEAERLREAFGALLLRLSEAADRLAAEVDAPSAARPRLRALDDAPEPVPPAGDSVEARHAAIQMAAAGSTRAQVGDHLRDYLGISDPTTLLDQLYGVGTAGSARVPWAIPPATGSGSR